MMLGVFLVGGIEILDLEHVSNINLNTCLVLLVSSSVRLFLCFRVVVLSTREN